MGTGTSQTGFSLGRDDDLDVTPAAIRTFGRLLVVTGGHVAAHRSPDGGLICEDRSRFARPALWRILPDGTVRPDSRYSFVRRGFVTTAVPQDA